MIVDDDQVIVNGLVSIIKKSEITKAEIITAFDGIDALEKLKGEGADLIITDIKMPGMDGLELVKKAKELKYCDRFVILTGYDEFEFARKAIRYQVNDYLLKPVNKTELLEIIHKVEKEINWEDEFEKELELPDIDACKITIDLQKCSDNMKKVIEYIVQNYYLDISLDKISDIFDINPNYLCSLFKNELGMTFLQYLHSVRIRKSIEILLHDKKKAVRDVALESGFMSERHFYKVFKKIVGITPGQFRNTYGSIK